jgi:hypothetical protein
LGTTATTISSRKTDTCQILFVLPSSFEEIQLLSNMSVRPDPFFKPVQETGPASGWAKVCFFINNEFHYGTDYGFCCMECVA